MNERELSQLVHDLKTLADGLVSRPDDLPSLNVRTLQRTCKDLDSIIKSLCLVTGRLQDTQLVKTLAEMVPNDVPKFDGPSDSKRRQIRDAVNAAIMRLKPIAEAADPIQQPIVILDPSDPDTVGRLIGNALLEQPKQKLAALDRFYGSGVYAIYFTGSFRAYTPISNTNTPIYVGKADPKSLEAITATEQGDKLWDRLVKDHAKSIRHARNLSLDDFECRYLVVKSAWQRTAEDYLIGMLKPIWNNEMRICYGFGKHGDAPERRSNTRSPWDTVHPGREWATREGNVPNPLSADQLIELILAHFEDNPPM